MKRTIPNHLRIQEKDLKTYQSASPVINMNIFTAPNVCLQTYFCKGKTHKSTIKFVIYTRDQNEITIPLAYYQI